MLFIRCTVNRTLMPMGQSGPVRSLPLHKWILFLLLLVAGMHTAIGQDKYATLTTRVTFTVKVISAASLMDELQKQTGYAFYFDKTELSKIDLRDLNFRNVTLGYALKYLEEYYGFSFLLNGKTIAVSHNPDFKSRRHTHPVTGRVTDRDRKSVV